MQNNLIQKTQELVKEHFELKDKEIHHVKVLIWNGSSQSRVVYVKKILKKHNFNIIYLDVSSFTDFIKNSIKLPLFIFKSNIIIAYPSIIKAFVPVFLAKIFRKPVILELMWSTVEARIYEGRWRENSFFTRLGRKVEKMTCNMSDLVLAHTRSSADYLSKIYSINKSKIDYLYCFVDKKMFKPIEKDKELLENLKLKNKFVVMFHGSFLKVHGVEHIIRSIPKVLKKHPNTVFLFVGKGMMSSTCKELSKELDVEKNVIFTGWVPFDEIPRYISLTDIWLGLFSSVEKVQRVSRASMFEVMGMGKPVITAKTRDASRILENNKNVIFTLPENPDDLAEKIVTLIENPDLRKKISKNALDFVNKNMSLDLFESKIIRFIKSLVKEYKNAIQYRDTQ